MRRIIFALILVLPIIAIIVFAPHPWSIIVAAALYLVAAWEWSGFVRDASSQAVPSLQQRVAIVIFYAILMIASGFAIQDPRLMHYLFVAALVWWVAAFIWILKYPTKIPKFVIVICGALVLVPAFAAILNARLFNPEPAAGLIYVFVLVWAADVGAYFVGRTFGRRKLAPRVSPGKSWEGFFGGMAAALMVAAVVAIVAETSLIAMLLISAFVVAGSVVGDLTVSMFKRHAGVKDAGVIFPGHGGVLDRFDSFSAAAPIMLAINSVHGIAITLFG